MSPEIHSPSKIMQYIKTRQRRLETYYRENNINPKLAAGDIIRLYALVMLADNVKIYQAGVDGAFHRERFRPLARYLFGHVRKSVERLTHMVIGSALFIIEIQDGELLSFRLPEDGRKDDSKTDARQCLIDWEKYPP